MAAYIFVCVSPGKLPLHCGLPLCLFSITSLIKHLIKWANKWINSSSQRYHWMLKTELAVHYNVTFKLETFSCKVPWENGYNCTIKMFYYYYSYYCKLLSLLLYYYCCSLICDITSHTIIFHTLWGYFILGF